MSTLIAKRLTHIFDQGDQKVTAVDAIDLHIESGSFITITGRSGSGKSTLLYHLAGLLHPTSGSLTYDGIDPYSLSPAERNRFRAEQIGILYPDFRLLPYLTVAENIATPSLAIPLSVSDKLSRTSELIEHFGLEHRCLHLPGALSSGEQQRTALARALFNEPKIIIADEPTGNLDEENSITITNTLKQYAALGNTVIVATHDPIITKLADLSIYLKEGSILPSHT